MAYQVNKSDGTIVSTVPDGQIDNLSTSLTLIGKNYSGFGESLNENFVKVLENFASVVQPSSPIRGQVWYDLSSLKLKVYNGIEFVPVSSATISSVQPLTLGVGDLWFNENDKQLYFYDGTSSILIGPDYSTSQGVSGFKVSSVLDTLNQTRVITLLYTNGILLGIFSKDAFTPKVEIIGFTGNIIPGFNAGNLLTKIDGVDTPLKFNVTVTNSEKLGGELATAYVRKDSSNTLEGQLKINSDIGIAVGTTGTASFSVNTGTAILANLSSNRSLEITVRKDSTQETAIEINPSTREINFYSGHSESQLNVSGDMVVDGNLTVNGATITISTEELTVRDKNLVLAKEDQGTQTEAGASSGGIVLQGNTSHVFLWAETDTAATVDSSEAVANGYHDSFPALNSYAWNSSEHINLVAGKEFRIGGIKVIDGTSLGSSITSIPGVTSIGTLEDFNVGPVETPGSLPTPYINIQNNRISSKKTDQNIELAPDGNGDISLISDPGRVGYPRVIGMGDPINAQDAVTKKYLDQVISTQAIILSLDLTDSITNQYIITNILTNLAPPGSGMGQYRNGTIARILCTRLTNDKADIDVDPLNPVLDSSFAPFVISTGPTVTANAVTSVSIDTTSLSTTPNISVAREIRVFQVQLGTWIHVPAQDVVLP